MRREATDAVSRQWFDKCRCGHDRQAHDHLRRGTDCSFCGLPGEARCLRFRRSWRAEVRNWFRV